MTASSPDELIAGFPHSSLPKVTGEPIVEDIKVIQRLLNTNAMSVASYEGGGRHEHLGIIMTNEEYFAVAVDVFPIPNNPGPSATVVAGMTAAVIMETTRIHKEETQVYHTYHNVDQAIKKLIIEAFDDAYLNAVSDEIVGYANCTSLQLLTHLLTYYAMISPTELTQNYERQNAPHDPNQPIETLFQQFQDGLCGSGWATLWRCNDRKCDVHLGV
jgi:6-pyruvoyl-tetrahydropterin synthase